MNVHQPHFTSDPGRVASRGAANDADLIDIRKVIAMFRRRSRLIIAVTAAVFIAACIALAMATPMYSATSQVVLDRARQQVVDVQSVTAEPTPDSPTVDTEVQVLQSPELAGRVVDALQLHRDPEFNPALRPEGFGQRVSAWFGGLVDSTSGAAAPDAEARARRAAVNQLRGNLQVAREGLTYAINITYNSPSPQTAARVANAVAEQYIQAQLDAKNQATEGANTFLSSRLSGLRAQVEAAEAAVQQYRAANGLLSAGGDESIAQQELASLNGQLAAARATEAERLASLSTARAQLARGSTGEDVGEALNSSVVSQLRAQRAQVSREVADLEGRYGPRHPELQNAQRRLADIDTQIAAEVRRLISNLEAQAEVARQRRASIESTIARTQGTLRANDNASVRLNELERNAESVRSLYQSFLDRYKETSAGQGLEQPDARLIKLATPPGGPSSPQPNLYLAGGLLGGLALAIVLVLLLQVMESGLATAEDVEQKLGVPSLGAVPLLSSSVDGGGKLRGVQPTRFIIDRPLSAFAEAFRSLRTSVLFSKMSGTVQVVAITSALPNEGKTTTALGITRAAALGGSKVVMVDCDVRRRAVNEVLGDDGAPGLIEVLNGSVSLDNALRLDEPTGAYWLPITGAKQTPRDMFESPAMDKLLADLRARFTLVILDTAPVLPIAETRVLATKADAVVFLVRWRKTPQKAVEASLRILESVGAYIAGVALTQVDLREQARGGYGDPTYYYKDYRAYYS